MDVEIPVVADEDVELPAYASEAASGADVYAHIFSPLVLSPGESILVPTGLRFEIPSGYEIQVRPRSGLALKNGITVLNAPGTIDEDYRGEVKVILINHGEDSFTVEPRMRIAQLVVAPIIRARFVKAEKISSSARGTGGFGHTGLL